MSKRGRELGPDEEQLWRKVTEGVQPRTNAKPRAEPPPAKPVKRAGKSAPPAPNASVKPAPPPADRGGEKRVRRGRIDIGATLDLHGHTQASARAALASFLQAAHRRGERTVVVVTGVGRAGEGVLKREFPGWLREPDLRVLVSGFAQAHRSHGGAGAFYVFLRRNAETTP